MFEPSTTFLSAANRCRSVAAWYSLVLLSVAAFGCGGPLDDERYNPGDHYVPPANPASQSNGSDPGSSGDGDDSGYGDDYDYRDNSRYYDDYDYGDNDPRDLAGGPGGCSDTCDYAHDGECDDGGPGADFYECAFGTDCGDCGTR